MDGTEPLEFIGKALEDDIALTVQERATQAVEPGIGYMLLSQVGSLAPPWWSESRDIYLGREWPKCPLFAGAVYNIAAKLATIHPIIEPRDPSSKAQRDQAERATIALYEGAEFGRGWLEFASKWYPARWTQDNGSFAEVLGRGPKDGPIVGMPTGIANLDSQRCQRTGNPMWPVLYTQQGTGKRFKLHHTRVIFSAQLPSGRDEMNGVGYSWLSRVLDIAQGIVDDLTYKTEKLGRRPKRAILVGKKMSVSQVNAAFTMADEAADNAGLRRVSMIPVVANETAADVGIDLVDLASLPDGFSWESDVTIGMYIIALTGGFPVRWMWPATAAGATKADALLQHMATAMSGAAHELGTLQLLLGGSEKGMVHQSGKFLPPSLKIRFDIQDDWMDQVQAEIQNTRSQSRERNLVDGAITVRVGREQMLQVGEITQAQFRQMELEDGRTQDGLPVDTLFYAGTNPYLIGVDPDDFTEEDVKAKLKEAKRASVLETDQTKRIQAKEAAAALEWLLEGDREEEAEPAGGVGFTHDDAPVRGAPREMTSTTATESASVMSEKERSPIERAMQREIQKVFDKYAPEIEEDIANGEEPDYSGLRTALIAVLITYLFRAFMDEVAELEAEYDVSFDPAEMAALGNEWATSFAPQEADRLIATTEKTVNKAAAAWAAGAITREQLEEMLEPAFSKSRAALIAITLITIALSYAFDVYKNLVSQLPGIQIEEYWETALDEKVCSICRPLHNQPRAEWEAQFPDGPPAHGRCRCRRRLEIIM